MLLFLLKALRVELHATKQFASMARLLPPKKAVAQQIYCKHRQVGASLVWEIAIRGKAWNLALVSVAIVMQKSMAFLLCQTPKRSALSLLPTKKPLSRYEIMIKSIILWKLLLNNSRDFLSHHVKIALRHFSGMTSEGVNIFLLLRLREWANFQKLANIAMPRLGNRDPFWRNERLNG